MEKELKINLLMIGILLCSLPLMAQTTEEPPETTTLVANNSYVFSYSKQELKGEAANFLVKATASSLGAGQSAERLCAQGYAADHGIAVSGGVHPGR